MTQREEQELPRAPGGRWGAVGAVCTFPSFHVHKVAQPRLSVPFPGFGAAFLINSSDELIKEPSFPQVPLLPFLHKVPVLPGKMSLPKDASGKVDCRALVNQLRECQTLQDQASCLHLLYTLK